MRQRRQTAGSAPRVSVHSPLFSTHRRGNFVSFAGTRIHSSNSGFAPYINTNYALLRTPRGGNFVSFDGTRIHSPDSDIAPYINSNYAPLKSPRGGNFVSFAGTPIHPANSDIAPLINLNSPQLRTPRDYRWLAFLKNGRPYFQKKCVLMCDVEIGSTSERFWKQSHSKEQEDHAEIKALKYIRTLEGTSVASSVTMMMSFSPCAYCAEAIIIFSTERPLCTVSLIFSCVYKQTEVFHRDGLRRLENETNVFLSVLTGMEWKRLAEATGTTFQRNCYIRSKWDMIWRLCLKDILGSQPKEPTHTLRRYAPSTSAIDNYPWSTGSNRQSTDQVTRPISTSAQEANHIEEQELNQRRFRYEQNSFMDGITLTYEENRDTNTSASSGSSEASFVPVSTAKSQAEQRNQVMQGRLPTETRITIPQNRGSAINTSSSSSIREASFVPVSTTRSQTEQRNQVMQDRLPTETRITIPEIRDRNFNTSASSSNSEVSFVPVSITRSQTEQRNQVMQDRLPEQLFKVESSIQHGLFLCEKQLIIKNRGSNFNTGASLDNNEASFVPVSTTRSQTEQRNQVMQDRLPTETRITIPEDEATSPVQTNNRNKIAGVISISIIFVTVITIVLSCIFLL